MTETEDGDAIAEELQVLEAVFCQDGEFTLHVHDRNEGSASFTICTEVNLGENDSSGTLLSASTNSKLSVNFTIGLNYPHTVPYITLSSSLITRKNGEVMKKCMLEYANENLLGEPMAMQLMEWVQEHAHEYANEKKTSGQSQEGQKDDLVISLLHLDHMRAKARYIRTLIGWSSELGIMGRIFFVDKLILILLEGHLHNVKEFTLRLRTQKVDVDSSGKSCKEKMMRVLSEAPSTGHNQRFTSFKHEELDDLRMLKDAFEEADLLQLYEQHVQPLHRHSVKDSVR